MKKFLPALGFLALLVGSLVRGQDKEGHRGDTKDVAVLPDAIEFSTGPLPS